MNKRRRWKAKARRAVEAAVIVVSLDDMRVFLPDAVFEDGDRLTVSLPRVDPVTRRVQSDGARLAWDLRVSARAKPKGIVRLGYGRPLLHPDFLTVAVATAPLPNSWLRGRTVSGLAFHPDAIAMSVAPLDVAPSYKLNPPIIENPK